VLPILNGIFAIDASAAVQSVLLNFDITLPAHATPSDDRNTLPSTSGLYVSTDINFLAFPSLA
jgi:hypothetical protein